MLTQRKKHKIKLMSAVFSFFWQRFNSFELTNLLNLLDLFLVISLVAGFLVYLRRFPLFRVISGVVFLILLAFVAILVGFTLTGLLLAFVSAFIVVALPLIFAPEVRHYLDKLGRFSYLKKIPLLASQKNVQFIQNLVGAAFELAQQKIGALIIIQRRTKLGNLVESGVLLDAHLGSKILEALFQHQSPLHDGAAVITENRIIAARCIVSVTPDVKLDAPFGTRHEAGVSISRETDAVSIIISEERGKVSLAVNGKLETNLSRAQLYERLRKLLG